MLFSIGVLVFIVLLFRPIALIQGTTQEYSENKILIEYEIFGCGSLVVRVIKGGENMASLLKSEYPNIATDEVRFTEDSDEPYLHLNSAEFWTAGLARGYNYIMEGEVVGATKGALNCCAENENDVAYNDIVPEFRVDRWYTANYMPYYKYGNGIVLLFLICGMFFCLAGTVFAFIKNGKKRKPICSEVQEVANQTDSTIEKRSMTQK